jgi:hypothetical protein
LHHLAEQLRRGIDIARGKRGLGRLEVGSGIAGAVADQPRNEIIDARLWQRAHEAVDRPPVLEGKHGGDRLHAHLAWDLRVLVDIELDQSHCALGRAHRLFEDRRELTAGPAPRRPEIDQDRHLARGFNHIAQEVLSRGVLDEVGFAAALIEDGGIYAHSRLSPKLALERWAAAQRLATYHEPRMAGISRAS